MILWFVWILPLPYNILKHHCEKEIVRANEMFNNCCIPNILDYISLSLKHALASIFMLTN